MSEPLTLDNDVVHRPEVLPVTGVPLDLDRFAPYEGPQLNDLSHGSAFAASLAAENGPQARRHGVVTFDSRENQHQTSILDRDDAATLGQTAAKLALSSNAASQAMAVDFWEQAVTFWRDLNEPAVPAQELPRSVAAMPTLQALLEAHRAEPEKLEALAHGRKGDEAFVWAAGEYAGALSRMVYAPNDSKHAGPEKAHVMAHVEEVKHTKAVIKRGVAILSAAGFEDAARAMADVAASMRDTTKTDMMPTV